MKTLHPGKFGLYLVLSLLDLFLTYRLLQVSDGHVYESNPIANAWLNRYGWAGLTTFKVMSMILVASATVCISLRHPRTGGGILTFACSALAVVVLYSCSLINYVSKGARHRETVSLVDERRPAEFEAAFAQAGENSDILVARSYPISSPNAQVIAQRDKKFPNEKHRALLMARMRQYGPTSPGWKIADEDHPPEVAERLVLPRERELGK